MTTKFLNPNVKHLLGFAPVCTVTDSQIWNMLLTPMTKALLGKRLDAKLEVRETVAGAFPGDDVTNLNDHRMYGGGEGFVRNRYVVTTYRTENGAFIVKRDGTKFKAFGYFGDLKKGQLELIFKAALRDRGFDGTVRANDNPLLDFTADAPKNGPMLHKGEPVKSVELSIYCFMPGSRTRDVCGDVELEQFFENPFRFLDRPELFKSLFDRAWKSTRSPGMVSNPVPDVSKMIIPGFEKLAKLKGYDFMEHSPSHFHVAMFSRAVGYKFADPAYEKQVLGLVEGIQKIKASGIKLTRSQESWVCVLQSLRSDLIPPELNMGGPKWPQDNISDDIIWMYKPMSEQGQKIVSELKMPYQVAPDAKSKTESSKAKDGK